MVGNTGPDYPRPHGAGSNGIGRLQIGESPIGSIPPFDWWRTVLSQYANSPILTTLIGNIFAYLDQTKNLDAFFDLIWNVDTAQGYGLDIWGRIVGVNRILQIPTVAYFGFLEALPGSLSYADSRFSGYSPYFGFSEGDEAAPLGFGPFAVEPLYEGVAADTDAGPFYGGGSLTTSFSLADESYRRLIFAKAAANITSGSIPAINQILLSLFPNRGNCYVTEGQLPAYFGFSEATNASPFGQAPLYSGQTIATMTMQYVFRFALSDVDYAIVAQSGVLPKPVGVAASIVIEP